MRLQKYFNPFALLRAAGVCAFMLWPQLQWAQAAADNTAQISVVDISASDTRPLPRAGAAGADGAPQQGQTPALGERRPRSGFRSQSSVGSAQRGTSAQNGAAASDLGSVQARQTTAAQQGAASAEGGSGRGGFPRADVDGQDAAAGSRGGFSRNGSAAAQAEGAAAGANGSGASREGRRPRGDAADDNTVQQLVMRDQALPDVLNFLEVLAKKSILRSQTLPAVKITFDSVGPMGREEAILAIESLLAINGIAITPVGERFLKAAPSAEVAKQVPPFVNGSVLSMQPSQQFYTKYFKLDYLDALNEGQAVVQGLMSVASKQEGNPVVFPKSNSILVTDMLVNLQRIEEVLTRSDKPAGRLEGGLHFFKLNHVKASDLKTRLTTLVAAKDSAIGSSFTHNTSFEADDRTNQLIVVTHESNLPLLRQLVEGLDGDVEPQTGSEVYYIKHAVAADVGNVLTSVITGQKQTREQANTSTNMANTPAAGLPAGSPATIPDVPAVSTAPGSVLTASDTRNLQFSDYVTVVPDERANAIVVYGTRTDLTQLGKLIEKIDILLAQVNIQVIIAEVTLSDGVSTGIDQLNIGYGADGLVTGGLAGWAGSTSGASYSGGSAPFNFTGTLDPKRFQLALNNAKKSSNFRLLSSPVIVTTHNMKGRVEVTERRPIITGTSTQLLDNPVSTNSVTYQNIGIKLEVTPRIGSNGMIQMEIVQEVENITGNVTVSGNEQPIIASRIAESYVSVRSGEVVVLAGLQESSFKENNNKLWLIGDIPLIGDFLSGKGKVAERRELMIFIQPFMMTTDEEISGQTELAIANLDNASEVRTYLETRDVSDVTIEQSRVSREAGVTPHNRPVTGPAPKKVQPAADPVVAEPEAPAAAPAERTPTKARGPRR